jgi:hypothetical protein
MHRWITTGALAATIVGVGACGTNESQPSVAEIAESASEEQAPVRRVHEPSGPAGYHFEELPPGWSIASRSGDRFQLAKLGTSDSWVTVSVEPQIPGDELERGLQEQEENARRSEGGEHRESGAIDTEELGTIVWSVNRFDEDEEVTDDLVVFMPHPSEYAAISLRYIYPASEDTSTRLVELVALAKAIAPGA